MSDQVKTSGTTGSPKIFELSRDLVAARVKRRALVKGKEYGELKSLFCALGIKNGAADPSRTVGTTHQAWANKNGVKFFAPAGHFDKTIELFNIEKPEGCVASQHDLLKYARAKRRTHQFKYILTGGLLLDPKIAQEVLDKLLAPGGVAYVTYSCSEGGTKARGTFQQAIDIPGCVGKVFDDEEFVIDPDRQIRFKVKRSQGHIEAYADPVLTAKHFKTIDGALWFYPGDTVELVGGLLVLKDRVWKSI